MKKATVKVYMEWVNYLGEVQSRELIATFNHVNWANKFVEGAQDVVDGKYTRFVVEE
jgi:hypothetical protein